MGQRSIDCLGLHFLLPFKGIICCDYGQETRYVADSIGAAVHSLEFNGRVRKEWRNYHIEDAIKSFVDSTKSPLLENLAGVVAIPYRSTRALEELSARVPLILAAPPSDVVGWFDDKFVVFQELGNAGIAQPRGVVERFGQTPYLELRNKLGSPLVIKLQRSASGTGCFIVREERQFERLSSKLKGKQVLVTEFISGLSYNIHGIILGERILFSQPSIQLVGLDECTNRTEVYVGNDFAAMAQVAPATVEAVQKSAMRVGYWMMSKGYQGIFGIDMVGDSEMFPVDINPRFQGSTWLLTQIEMANGHIPMSLMHVLNFVDIEPYSTNLSRLLPNLPLFRVGPFWGAKLILHSLENSRRTVRRSINPGVYHIKGSQIEFARPGALLSDCTAEDEFIITGGVPTIGTVVEPGASLLKIVSPRSLIDLETRRLSDQASNITRQIYGEILLD